MRDEHPAILRGQFFGGETEMQRAEQRLLPHDFSAVTAGEIQMMPHDKRSAWQLVHVLILLLLAVPLYAQPSPEDIVQRQRDPYGEMVTPQEAPILLKAIAVDLTQTLGIRYGLLPKTTGNQCGGFACDIICTASEHWDVLGSGPSGDVNAPGASTAQWLPKGAVPRACELVDAVISGGLNNPPAILDSAANLKLAELSSAVEALTTRIALVEAQLASVTHDVQGVRDDLETRTEGLASAVVALADRTFVTSCHASAFGIPIHCEVK